MSLSLGLTGGSPNVDGSNIAYGVNGSLMFGRWGFGGKKYASSNSDKFNITELGSLLYGIGSFRLGAFYGGFTADANSFLKSFNFNDVSWQYGASIEWAKSLGSSFRFGVEGRYHIWSKKSSGTNFISAWVNLDYIFF